MSNQNEHTSVEMENKENDPEVKYKSIIEEDCPEDSSDSDSPDSLGFELKMYNIKNLKNKDEEKDSKQENGSKRENEPNRGDEQEFSYRKFSRINTDTKSPFTKAQIDLIKNVSKSIVRCVAGSFDTNMPVKMIYGCICIYFDLCINKHYFLVDTIAEDIKYIELYDLKTNQLVNTFQRQNLCKSVLNDFPSYYAVSNNGKLLAYLSFPTKGVTIYSIECGLEIAKLAIILDTSIFRTVVPSDRIFLYFFHNDEKLLIYFSETEFSSAVWAVWDIFSSLRDSVKLNQQNFILELPSIEDNLYYGLYVEKSNSCIVVYQKNLRQKDKLFIYDDLVVDKYFNLKESDKQVWNTRNLEEHEEHTREFKIDKIYEPWLPMLYRSIRLDIYVQYSFYLDEKQEKLLIIGSHTVQVWHRGTLKFIYSPSPAFDIPNISNIEDWYPKIIEVMSIKYCSEKFKFKIQIKEDEVIKQIKMDDENDIMYVAKYACNTLEYFSVYKKNFEEIYVQTKTKSNFDNFIEQTRNIILKLIRLYPTEWRLLDIRFDLMSALVKAGEYELVYYILSFEKLIHIPQYLSWSGKENTSTTISTALSDNTMLACFLEYYSNNAIHNIGWMNTVVDIIPKLFKSNKENGIKEQGDNIGWMNTVVDPILKLFKSNKENDIKEQSDNIGWMNTVVDTILKLFKSNKENGIKEQGNYKFYAQKLFYSSCFCDKEFDLLSFEILEVSPKSSDLLKVYIPITQLIPQKSELDLQEIDYDKIANIRMVPLMDFTTNKRIPDIKKGILTNFLEILFSPRRHLSPGEVDYSPFIKLIETGERDIFYENPSMGAVINWMCYILIRDYTFENGFKNAESSQIFTFIIFLSILVLWYEFILLLRIFEDFAQNINILYNFIIALRQFLLFFILVIIAMGHVLFILLGYSSNIGLNQISEESDNPFSNIINAILAVYDWSSISFDTWNFWPLTIISVIGSFIFVIILQNVIISFMSEAFSNVVEDSKRGLYRYQIDLIHEFTLLEKSLEFSDLDSNFKDKIRAKYICFYDDPNITKSWKEKSEQIRLKPYPKIQTLRKSEYESLFTEEDIYSLFSNDDPNITKSWKEKSESLFNENIYSLFFTDKSNDESNNESNDDSNNE
ncbi:transient receptor potential cation channel subfamily a member 1-like isoform x1 [Gigaspora margarita]|uniref:Transient receptor potential cation channel subfamily a member 1-like isoform x1 n=1 Tax=Gigaspora margarita TaxID=4874 RepID=A0A8H4B0U1_GIGMA|nr:transient receptor potential cation channel subfamily a member 1-like isoform x1 [Gigaspora margarita]